MLTACGGGGGSSSSPVASNPPPIPVPTPVPVPPPVPTPIDPSRFNTVVTSQATAVDAPAENVLRPSGIINVYTAPRTYAYSDLQGDGCTDMVVAPTYFDHKATLPLEIYQGDCKGGYVKATDIIIAGAIPTTGSVNNIFVRDFNGDGRNDLMIIDQGLEDQDAMSPGFDGAKNILLLSDSTGKLTAQASTFMDDNSAKFNHLSAVSDIDGDGSPDLVLVRLGGPKFGKGGAQVFLNDKHGHFTEKTADLLPAEVTPSLNTFDTSGAAISDLDGDNKPEIILTSYSTQQTVILKVSPQTGKYEVGNRYDIPKQFAGIGYVSPTKAPDNGRGLGGSSIAVADFNGDSKKDIAILWEGSNKSHVQILQSMGGTDFMDATGWLDGNAATGTISRLSAIDANGDGTADLVAESFSYSINDLATKSPYLVYNKVSNKMTYLNILGEMTPAQFASANKLQADKQMGFRVVDLNQDNKLDFLVVDAGGLTKVTDKLLYFSNATFYGAIAK